MVDGESAFRSRVAGLSAEQQAKALEWFYRGCDKQRARIQQLEFELEKGLLI
jgi:phosphatidylserine/phosphatidylglycerophosphate/cardiolipin synthase-like enzyme